MNLRAKPTQSLKLYSWCQVANTCDRSESPRPSEKVSLECLSRANPNGSEGSPIWETLSFSDTIRCEPMPLDAPDQLSNLVPSTIRVCCWRSHLSKEDLGDGVPRLRSG